MNSEKLKVLAKKVEKDYLKKMAKVKYSECLELDKFILYAIAELTNKNCGLNFEEYLKENNLERPKYPITLNELAEELKKGQQDILKSLMIAKIDSKTNILIWERTDKLEASIVQLCNLGLISIWKTAPVISALGIEVVKIIDEETI